MNPVVTEIEHQISKTIIEEKELTPDERVAKGATYLDEHAPGWANLINPNMFEIGDLSRCILGQLYGDYGDAIESGKVKIGYSQSHKLGFDLSLETELDKADSEWEKLQKAWINEIETRVSK